MKRLLFSLITISAVSANLSAQQTVAGEYYLEGVMETASGFNLRADSTFQFFFSYGALDRFGSGKWSINNNEIVLNSKPYPGKDFKLVSASRNGEQVIIVKIEDPNPEVYSWVHCLVRTDREDTVIDANSSGLIRVPATSDSIYLISEFCSERISSFPIDKTRYNYFTFHFEPWIMEVFFKDFSLQFIDGHLEGKHPLLQDDIYKYVK
jgi:hypothetical protein